MIDGALPYLRCPVCEQSLTRSGPTLRCPAAHGFDLARQGYLHPTESTQSHHWSTISCWEALTYLVKFVRKCRWWTALWASPVQPRPGR